MPALDGLRGIAVLAVLLFHAGVSWVPGGFLGVSTFFTLSGFLITTLLLGDHERDGTVELRSFWVRRVRRLLPASLAALAAVAVVGRFLMPPEAIGRLGGDMVAAVAYTANWRFVATGTSYADLFAAPSLVQHFWSLAIEEQFYLLFPVLALLALRRSRATLAVAAGVLAAAGIAAPWVFGYSVDRTYYGTDTRAPELLVGVLLALAWDTRPVRAAVRNPTRFRLLVAGIGVVGLGSSVAAWGVLGLHTDALYLGGFAGYAVASAAVVAAATLPARSSPVAAVLALAPLRWLGQISYGLYLVHWPLFLVLTPERTGWRGATLLGARLAGAVGVALVSHFVLERPIRRGSVIPDRFVLGLVPIASIVVLALVVAVVPLGGGSTSRIAFAEESAAPPEARVGVGAGTGDEPPAEVAPRPPYRVLVVGTPESKPLADALAAAAEAGGGMEITTSLAACGGARESSDVEFTTELDTCRGWVDTWGKAVAAKPEVVVLLQPLRHTALMGLTDIVLRKDAGALVDLLTKGGAKLVPVTVPGKALQPYDTTVREVAADAGADAGTVEGLDAAQAGPQLYEAVLADRPAVASPAAAGKKVMIVGDSVASNLGRALELWGRRTGRAVVWNAAALGCGVASGGITNAQPPYDRDTKKCLDWRATWKAKVDEFRPDVVVVLSGPWDLPDRKVPGHTDFQHIGDTDFDRWLLGQYQRAHDTFAAHGASVVWLTAPCVGTVWGGYAISGTGAFDNDRIRELNSTVLRQIAGTRVVDLYGLVCPGDEFLLDLGGVSGARPDGLHFVEEAALWVAEQLGPEIVA